MSRFILPIAALFAFLASAAAQDHQPYSGMEQRQVKALSDQQIEDLRTGRGMGLALAAELNGYPGPLHVLELADGLQLTPAQRAAVERLHAAMKAETIPLGERLIAEETALDRLFRDATVTPASLASASEAIGRTQARLRAAHLSYHLTTAKVLTPDQIRRYAQLRGYGQAPESSAPHAH